MDVQSIEKLNKVLALADSAQEGEALAALRATRTMLSTRGMSLSGLLRRAVDVAPLPPKAEGLRGTSNDVIFSLQRELIQMKQHAAQMQKQQQALREEVQHWRKTAENRAATIDRLTKERDHWQNLARETADKLWDAARALSDRIG